MEFKKKQLKKIEKLASLYFTYEEIATALRITIDDFIDEVTDEDTKAFHKYQLGKIKSEIPIREQTIEMAKMGSPIAQQEARKLALNQKIKENA